VFGHGDGFATPTKTRPLLSTAGGYQRPPPPLTFGCPQILSPSLIVLNDHLVAPVVAFSA
jgi:hypothetical protein